MSDVVSEALRRRLRKASSRLTELLEALSKTRADLDKLDGLLTDLELRLNKVRSTGYPFFRSLDEELKVLRRSWNETRGSLLTRLITLNSWASSKAEEIRSMAKTARQSLRAGDQASAEVEVASLEDLLNEVEKRLRPELAGIEEALRPFSEGINRLTASIKLIENSLPFFEQASFKLKPGERFLFAAKSKLVGEGEAKGVFYMTDKRLLFEEVREVVIRRRFLFFTEKKLERKLLIDLPYDRVEGMSKTILGLLAGYGLKVSLTGGAGELSFDLKEEEIDFVLRALNYIRSGRAEADKKLFSGP